ncbi:Ni/Fe-hydrogenase, b-type cytochrome subunit [Thermodesulfatator indicus DSM 15286]|uniref:Ni/Fe-hydrogenase, b-type cytochrome subunit n=1 Tax=Thermodesulfatator indicus (strain DSM 15286 / JCM 11887 / CIR29812) TaxID=667014 RepID=F8A9X3_THEID|nr:Ni/Fe-hydrogenase, b-type cytochrome subunit [Thermodesulfatator indicus]AEH44172.1 Ni/Fe-hydrogenase, b-type cytochrome subunit [Thermodesulfatator indicus DSM 15286]
MGGYRRVKVWSVLMRLYHWAFALSIVTLCITGYYIRDPFVLGVWEGINTNFIMAEMRYIHFLAGYIFIAAIMVRLYLFIFGNKYERFTDFIPVTPRNIRGLFITIKHYLYLTDEHVGHGGHNPLAGTAYMGMVFLGIIMILTGLYLMYPENGIIYAIGTAIFGNQQVARLWHYFLFWIFAIFCMVHIYLVVWNDIFGDEGIISSIFSGRKYLKDHH